VIAGKEEAPAAGRAWGPRRKGVVDADRAGLNPFKRLATARAHAALLGIALHALEDDRGAPLYVASCNALTRQFADLAGLEHWLELLDGAA